MTTSKESSSSGIASALACTSGNSSPAASFAARARSSRTCELSRPTGRAPAPREGARPLGGAAAQLEHVLPRNVAEHLQLRLRDLPQAPGAGRRSMNRAFRSSYSALWPSQNSRFLRACSVRSGAFIAEPELELALRRLRRVRAVHQVVRHREREVAADRPGRRLGRVRRAHRRADDRDRRLALERERERRRRGDELDQLAEERLLGVLGVVRLGELAVDLDEPRVAERRARGARSARGSRRPACRCTASGLISTSVRSTAIGGVSLGAAFAREAA